MKAKLHYVFSFTLFLIFFSAQGQNSYWSMAPANITSKNESLEKLNKGHFSILNLDLEMFKQELGSAPLRGQFSGRSNTIVSFPDQNGEMERYRVVEAPVLSEELSMRHPEIKTYLGFGIDNPGARVRFSVTPKGVKTMTTFLDRTMVLGQPLDPEQTDTYILYDRKAKNEAKSFDCLTENIPNISIDRTVARDANDQLLRTFRMAISATGEYTNNVPGNDGTAATALAEVVATLNRTNEVFEVDMAITFSLVTGTEIIYTNANSDPYTSSLNSQLQTTLTSEVGEANYDIGHLFSFGANNGNAGCIGCVCEDGSKGSGWSRHSFVDNDGGPYMSDFFDIDYVPHEIGHQMGANHTWSFSSEGTGVNYEPGSGTTIMGYAGITGADDVQDHSHANFHYASIDQILTNVNSAPNNCATTTAITNSPPVANAGSDYSIPQGTAFKLIGSATDANGSDVLSYAWEQIDDGVTTNGTFSPTKTTGALWRARPPSSSPIRYMPNLTRVSAGQLTESNPVETVDNTSWETVSTVGRNLNFALTVRDRSETGGVGQSPQSDFDTMTVAVDAASGPFIVTSQSTNETWLYGSSQTITWNVAGTDSGAINTSNVDVLLSVDGGMTFPYLLADDVPNSGTTNINVPNVGGNTSTARVIVEASDNIFYAMNSTDFSIQEPEFSMTFTEDTIDVCSPSDAVYLFVYNTFSGFSGTTTFTAEGLPAGASASFSPATAAADGTNVTMTVSGIGSVATGNYPFTVRGTSGAIEHTAGAVLIVFDANFGSLNPSSPIDGATGISPDDIIFGWDSDANATSYDIDIATDAGFATIVVSTNVSSNTYTTSLLPGTQYWWRVRAKNNCGDGLYEDASFGTGIEVCDVYDSTDTPLAIPDNDPAGVSSVINVTNSVTVNDVNVSVNITHTWDGDLTLTLLSPTGTSVELSSGNGGQDDNYTGTTFDDAGTNPITSGSAPFTGTFQPEGSLASLNGESSVGNWTLMISDSANQDTGTLLDWSLEVCGELTLSSPESFTEIDNFSVFPNPNNGEFTVKLSSYSGNKISMALYDIRGRIVYNQVDEGTTNFIKKLNLSSLESGIYILKLSDGVSQGSRKIIVN